MATLSFTLDAWRMLKACLDIAEDMLDECEVQWWGRLIIIKGGAVCDRIVVPPQVGAAAHIDTDIKQHWNWQREHFKLGPGMSNKEIRAANEEMQHWRLWCHSHGRMGTTFSPRDDNNLAMLAEEAGDYFLGMVVNTKGDSRAYLCQRQPFHLTVDLGAVGIYYDTDDLAEEAMEMMSVVERKPVTTVRVGKAYGHEGAYGGGAAYQSPLVESPGLGGDGEGRTKTYIKPLTSDDQCSECFGTLVEATERDTLPSGAVVVTRQTVCIGCGAVPADCDCPGHFCCSGTSGGACCVSETDAPRAGA